VGQTPVAEAIAVAMSSTFGVGNSAFRTVSERTMLVDTVAFPAYTRAVLDRVGPFDTELVRNQDDEYNYRLRKFGGRVLLAADVRARYYSRSSLRTLWRQYFQYGYWKVRVLQKHPRQMRARQFIPALFVSGLLAGVVLSPWMAGRMFLSFLAGAYVLANLVAVGVTSRRVSTAQGVATLPAAFAILHMAYGSGCLVGLVRFWNRWTDSDSLGSRPERGLEQKERA
jgi:hypothetical protein